MAQLQGDKNRQHVNTGSIVNGPAGSKKFFELINIHV